MKKFIILFLVLSTTVASVAQIDKKQLALDVSKADAANTKALKAFIWKRKSDVSINGELKVTTITEFSFDSDGKLQAKMIDAESATKKKPKKSAAEDKMEYVGKSLELAMAYTFMTEGQLLDFYSKALVVEKDGYIEAMAENVYVQGDRLNIHVDPKTKLYIYKKFSSSLGKDPVNGEIKYEKFSSGVNHGSETMLNMPAKKMNVVSKNQDYSKRVE